MRCQYIAAALVVAFALALLTPHAAAQCRTTIVGETPSVTVTPTTTVTAAVPRMVEVPCPATKAAAVPKNERGAVNKAAPANKPTTAAVPKPANAAPKATAAANKGPRAGCTSFDMSKQSRQLCLAQKVSMPSAKADVVKPRNSAQLTASATAACKQLGRQFITADPSSLAWSMNKASCFNGATTVPSDYVWSRMDCCTAAGAAGLQLPGTMARERGSRGTFYYALRPFENSRAADLLTMYG